MSQYAQFELLKDIDLRSVNKWSAMACYAAKPQQPICMVGANGEQVCLPANVPYIDGAAAILGTFQTTKTTCMPFDQSAEFGQYEKKK